jgi:hypothetical protein
MEAEGQKFKICKTCKAAIKNGTKELPVVASSAPAETKTETAKAPAAEAPASASEE